MDNVSWSNELHLSHVLTLSYLNKVYFHYTPHLRGGLTPKWLLNFWWDELWGLSGFPWSGALIMLSKPQRQVLYTLLSYTSTLQIKQSFSRSKTKGPFHKQHWTFRSIFSKVEPKMGLESSPKSGLDSFTPITLGLVKLFFSEFRFLIKNKKLHHVFHSFMH